MAESSSADRTEQPTAKRLRDARKRGQVPRSRELATALIVGGAAMIISSTGPNMVRGAADLMRRGLSFDSHVLESPDRVTDLLWNALSHGLMIVAPLLFGSIVFALAGPLLLGGWNFSIEAIQPDFSRMSPMKGIGRIFSTSGLFETGKSLLKIAVIGGVAAGLLWREIDAFAELGFMSAASACGQAGRLALHLFEWLAGGLVAIAAIDGPYQRWSYTKQLKMTKQEVRDEHKQSEGRPEIKAKIRKLQYDMSQRRMMEAVPGADVIVTNPTHYAVALRYNGASMRAPRVVAKGRGEIALAIRELARENKVPLLEAPPLARALYRSVELDQEIPAALYAAVATVLTYVYQLRNPRPGQAPEAPRFEAEAIPGGEPD